jgi:hypothetical protein
VQQVGAFQHKLSRDAPATARKVLASKVRLDDLPPAMLQKMREPAQPMGCRLAACYDPAVVKVYREEPDNLRTNVRRSQPTWPVSSNAGLPHV